MSDFIQIRVQIQMLRGVNRPLGHYDAVADTMEKMLAVVEVADTVSRSNGMSLYALQNLHKALAALVLEGPTV